MTADTRPAPWLVRLRRRLAAARPLPFLRADVVLMVILGAVGALAASGAASSLRDGPVPVPTPLAAILSEAGPAGHHVETSGLLFPETHLAYPVPRRGARRAAEYVYVAMVEEDSKVLLVKFDGDLGHGEPRHVTVAGLLRRPEGRLRSQLAAMGWRLGGLPVEERYILAAGITPVPWGLSAAIAAGSGLLALALLAAMLADRRPRAAIEPPRGPA